MVRTAVSDDGESFETVVPAMNRFGREIQLRVVGRPLRRDGGDTSGAILVMEATVPAPAE